MHSNESSAQSILNLVPGEEKSAASAHSLCENVQRYKRFDSIVSMKSHVKRHGRSSSWCSLHDVDAKREKEKQPGCTVGVCECKIHAYN